jgi:type I restriction enzyme S subunit
MGEATRTENSDTLPDLPAEWESGRLADLARILSGGTPSKKNPEFWTGTIPWASPKDLKRPYLHDAQDHISKAGLEDGSRLAPAGSLFVVIRGMILGRDVPVSMAMVPMAFNQDMKAIVPNGRIDGGFLLYAFGQFKHALFSEIGTSAHGTRRIGTSAIEEFRVPLPPVEEQRAIAYVLDTVQRAKEATEKAVEAARQLKQSLMRHLFTYGPVPVEEADRVPLKDTAIGPILEHWQVEPLESLAQLVSGGTPSKSRADFWQGKIPWASPKDMKVPRLSETEDYISAEAAEEGSRIVPAGTVFIVIRGMILAKDVPVAMTTRPMAFNQDMKAILPTPSLDPEFLLYLLVQHKGRLMPDIGTSAHGTKRISTSAISRFLLPLPPLDQQREIASLLAAIDEKLDADERRRSALQSLFSSLLHHLMTGKVRVDDFDLPIAAEGPP